MPNTIKVNVRYISKRNEKDLFVRGTIPGQRCFVRRDDNDHDFFDFLYEHVKEGNRFNDLKISVDGQYGKFNVPTEYINIHRDGLVYIVDTNYPQDELDPKNIKNSKLNKMFFNRLMDINQFLLYPFIALKGENITIYYGDDRKERNVGFDSHLIIEDKVKILDELISGNHEAIAEQEKIHLIINTTGNPDTPVFNMLAQNYGHKFKKHSINRS